MRRALHRVSRPLSRRWRSGPASALLHLDAAAAVHPHPAKVETGGEDAHFVAADEGIFGVFDGVGGWASHGVDAGAFSRDLAARCSSQLLSGRSASLDLAGGLAAGLAEVSCLGSCTACLLRIDRRDGALTALNLGDSGFRIFRPAASSAKRPCMQVEAASQPQQHYFNCPLQLGGGSADAPSDGDAYSAAVQPGDLVLLATDGLFDNLFDDEIASLVDEVRLAARIAQRTAARCLHRTAHRSTCGTRVDALLAFDRSAPLCRGRRSVTTPASRAPPLSPRPSPRAPAR
jgi:protein phosphatase PTC7